jgi:hypothetical protein
LGCATQRTRILPRLEIIDIPPLNSLEESEIGDTFVSKGKIYTYDGIELQNRVKHGDGFILLKVTVEPGDLTAQEEDAKWTYYFAPQNGVKTYDAILGENYRSGGLKISKQDAEKVSIFINGKGSVKPKPKPIFTAKTIRAYDKPSFRQELIYNGISGDNVKFLYREISNDLMRPAFTQEVQYDLSQEMTIGFKGVRIQIIEASNTRLKYKVLTSFPDAL